MKPPLGRKSICLPFESEAHYEACLDQPKMYRDDLQILIAKYPELFPPQISHGFNWHDSYYSTKQQVRLRRMKLTATGEVYSVRPSFLLPYGVARTSEVEKALYLRQFGVPFDALAYVFGRDAMFWYRAWMMWGRFHLVGTTIKDPAKLPAHLVADEKQTWVRGEKCYVPTVVGAGCILGVSVVTAASSEEFKRGYGEFAAEAAQLLPAYSPQTVCTDGWQATREAWRWLYPSVTLVLCFLHSVLKIRDRCRGVLRQQVLDRVWRVYEAATARSFSPRLRRVREWAAAELSGAVGEAVEKMCRLGERFLPAYAHPQAHRTSNGVDRLMNHQDRLLYAMRYFHHTTDSAHLAVRAMALQWNFHPYGERLRRADRQRVSPFDDVNGFHYHANWLHNLLIASSMGGLRC